MVPASSGLSAGDSSSSSSPSRPGRTSKSTNLSQAATNALTVLRLPNPYTVTPCLRIHPARRAKSLSLETVQNIKNLTVYSKSMASLIIAPSVAFFPVVYANCCIQQALFPSLHLIDGPVAIYAPHASLANIGYFGHQPTYMLVRYIVCVDQDCDVGVCHS